MADLNEVKANLEEQANKVYDALKDTPEKLANLTKESSVLKEVLGDDGKFSADDVSRIVDLVKEKVANLTGAVKAKVAEEEQNNERFKEAKEGAENFATNVKEGAENAFGKAKDALLGEDGKLDASDVGRVAGDVAKGAGDAFNKAKDAILGDDGKFDASDVSRVAGDVAEGAKDILDKAKGLFSKKD